MHASRVTFSASLVYAYMLPLSLAGAPIDYQVDLSLPVTFGEPGTIEIDGVITVDSVDDRLVVGEEDQITEWSLTFSNQPWSSGPYEDPN